MKGCLAELELSGRACGVGQVNVLKGCNSLFTLLCIGMLVRYYWLMTIFERLKLLLDRRASASDTQVSLCQVLAVCLPLSAPLKPARAPNPSALTGVCAARRIGGCGRRLWCVRCTCRPT